MLWLKESIKFSYPAQARFVVFYWPQTIEVIAPNWNANAKLLWGRNVLYRESTQNTWQKWRGTDTSSLVVINNTSTKSYCIDKRINSNFGYFWVNISQYLPESWPQINYVYVAIGNFHILQFVVSIPEIGWGWVQCAYIWTWIRLCLFDVHIPLLRHISKK